MIYKSLEEIYHGYQNDKNLKNYINKKIITNMSQGYINGPERTVYSEINLRSSKENRKKFVDLYKTLYNTLFSLSSEVCCDSDFEDLILGYIHLNNINFRDDILTNLDFTLQGNISRFYLYNNESKETIFNQENSYKIFKIGGLNKGKKSEKYAIPFKKTSPFDMIKIAVYDSDVMLKTHHLYLTNDVFLKLTKDQQDAVKKFVDERKREHIQIFGESKDGVFPLITKDVVGLINEMIYPELDIDKQFKKIIQNCKDEFSDFEDILEKYGSGYIQKDSDDFKCLIVYKIKYFLDSIDKVKKISLGTRNIRQELLQINSYIWNLLRLDVVKCFTKSHQKFNDTVEAKREELKREVSIWKKEEGVDVDWFLDLLQA